MNSRTKRLPLIAAAAVAVLSLLAAGCTPALVSIQLVNEARESRGIPPVLANDTLGAKAQSWAEAIAAQGRLVHSNLSDGVGSGWSSLGENLAMAGSVEEAHQLFLDSSSHRATMLSGRYSQIGVGVAEAGGRVYVVQEYGG
jgi:uncharacterized protein YkwD